MYSAQSHTYRDNGFQRSEGRPTGSHLTPNGVVVGDHREVAIPSTHPLPTSDDRREFPMTANASYDHDNDSYAPANDRDEQTHDFLQFSHFTQDMNTNLHRAEQVDDDGLYLGDF